ncbi:hypothetical protein WAE61_18295 [Comamonadaceae bacterium PP-2]
MKVLIVDDRHEKVEKIASIFSGRDISFDIVHETNALSARRRLKTELFDLMLVDLQLPEMPGSTPVSDGGIRFFDLLMADPRSKLPNDIYFVTSEDSLIDSGRAAVESRGCSLCVIGSISDNWRQQILGRFSFAYSRAARVISGADVVIVTALAAELEAVLALDYEWTRFRIPDDPTLYHRGKLQVGDRQIQVVAASPLRKGMAASAVVATKLVLKFSPSVLIMTGICAGVEGKTNMGDVVVGNPTWDWGSGKHALDDDGSSIFKLSPKQCDLSVELSAVCDEASRSDHFKRRVRSEWSGAVPAGEIRCHLGPMASGASVIANSDIAKEILEQNRDVIAIEMEAFAVMVAAEYSTTLNLKSLSIKSVCDFADHNKRDDWQAYAAFTSAMFADEVVKRIFQLT